MATTDRAAGDLGPYALVLPWFRNELPGWGALYHALGLDSSGRRWAEKGWRRVRLRNSGREVWLDLSYWRERLTFFLGRYHEFDMDLVLRSFLQPGDQFIDVGSNVGFISLLADSLVGPSGSVFAFEPNPAVAARCREHLEMNGMTRVELHEVAVSDREGTFRLRVPPGDPMSASFALDDDPSHEVHEVKVVRGDDVVAGRFDRTKRTLMKFDVEGHEPQALLGFNQTIDELRPAITTEFLKPRGGRALIDSMFEIIGSRGYNAYEIGLAKRGLGHRLSLRPALDPVQVFDRTRVVSTLLWLLPEHEGSYRDAFE